MSVQAQNGFRGFDPWVIWLLVVPAASGLVYRVFFPARPDYLGHFLAGLGASLPVIWFLSIVANGKPIAPVLGVLLTIGLGYLTEVLVFPLGGYDWADFYNQSVGAALAGLGMIRCSAGDADLDPETDVSFVRNGHGVATMGTSIAALMIGTVFAFS